jgi:hypothetical protein
MPGESVVDWPAGNVWSAFEKLVSLTSEPESGLMTKIGKT